MREPDFFIVGAPKCGTKSLYTYLKQHPDVFMPEQKELHYFSKDLHPNRFKGKDAEKFFSCFAGAKEEKRVGEASVWYLYSQVAAEQIKAFNPEARIIAMLRNPVDMVYSLHAQMLYNGWEDEADFTRAMALEEERKRGLHIPKHATNPKFHFYREAAKYTDQMKRFIDAFGRDRVHVIIFDDFKNNTAGVYHETCQFLDIDPSIKPEFKVINSNKVLRVPALRAFFSSPHYAPTRRLISRVLPPPLRKGAKSLPGKIRQINVKVEKRPPMDATLRQSLYTEFAPEVERLSQLLGRDLTSLWT